jgi:hypothetical protein
MHYELVVAFSNFVTTFCDGGRVVRNLKMNVVIGIARG